MVCTAACSVLAACVWGAITAQVGTVAAACGAALAAVCVAAAVLDSLLVARARWQQRSRAASLKQLPGPSYNEGRPAWVDRERGLLDSLVTLAAHHRSAFKVWFGSVPCVVIAQPDDVNFVVKSNERLFDKGASGGLLHCWGGGRLFGAQQPARSCSCARNTVRRHRLRHCSRHHWGWHADELWCGVEDHAQGIPQAVRHEVAVQTCCGHGGGMAADTGVVVEPMHCV